MRYPFFERLAEDLLEILRTLPFEVRAFRRWQDDLIFATGIEAELHYRPDRVPFSIELHVDWDFFREQLIAPRFFSDWKAEEKPAFRSGRLRPTLDFEFIWRFDREAFSDSSPYPEPETVRQRLDQLQRALLRVQEGDTLLTRWHVDISSAPPARFVTAVLFLAYTCEDLSLLGGWTELEEALRIRLAYLNRVSELFAATFKGAG
jgi:hypothetical protein|nr:MAG: hypothetical protein KatS3mg041_0177 [Bacteroidota bacterium]